MKATLPKDGPQNGYNWPDCVLVRADSAVGPDAFRALHEFATVRWWRGTVTGRPALHCSLWVETHDNEAYVSGAGTAIGGNCDLFTASFRKACESAGITFDVGRLETDGGLRGIHGAVLAIADAAGAVSALHVTHS